MSILLFYRLRELAATNIYSKFRSFHCQYTFCRILYFDFPEVVDSSWVTVLVGVRYDYRSTATTFKVPSVLFPHKPSNTYLGTNLKRISFYVFRQQSKVRNTKMSDGA